MWQRAASVPTGTDGVPLPEGQERLRRMQGDGSTPEERLRRQIAALADFGLYAFRSNNLDALLHRSAELVSQGLSVRLAKVLELLPGGQELLIRAGVNWKPGVVGHVTFGADGDSPAGYALCRGEPVISLDLSRETRFRVPEVLVDHGVESMINVIIPGAEHPFGVLEVDSPGHRGFDSDDIAFLGNYANLLAAAVERHRASEGLREAAREQDVLIQELAHRVKNMLGLVQSLATQTCAEGSAARAYQETFVGRLQALARAESLLFDDHAQEVDLARLVPRSVEPFSDTGSGAVSIDGPSLMLPARNGRILALVLHELGTNAAKYGALSTGEGRVRVTWKVEQAKNDAAGRSLRLCWNETVGPPVAPPRHEGFGTRLLTTLASYELDGEVQLEHLPGGLRYQVVFRVPSE